MYIVCPLVVLEEGEPQKFQGGGINLRDGKFHVLSPSNKRTYPDIIHMYIKGKNSD